MSITAKPLPLDELQATGATSDPLWLGMGDYFQTLYQAGVDKLAELAEIRKLQGSAEQRLETSDDPEAITFREWRARADSAKAKVDAETAEELKAAQEAVHQLKLAISERKKKIDATLNEQRQKALEAEAAKSRSDVNITQHIEEYKTITEQFKSIVDMFAKHPGTDVFKPLEGFRLPGPGVASGATKVSKGSGADGTTKRFRWGTVTVDDKVLNRPNTKTIALAAGSRHDKNLLTALLTSLNGVWENLPRDPEPGHTFEFNGHRITLALRKAEPRKSDSTGSSTEEDQAA